MTQTNETPPGGEGLANNLSLLGGFDNNSELNPNAHEKQVLCVLGIDPGTASGAYAFAWNIAPDRCSTFDMPTVAGQLDCATFAEHIAQMRPDFAIVERAASRPGQGVSSVFKFGQSYGAIIAILATLRIRTHIVAPAVWKRHFRLDSDKEKSRALALRLFAKTPEHFGRKRDHNRAESALLALYGARLEHSNSQFPEAKSFEKTAVLHARGTADHGHMAKLKNSTLKA